MILSLRDKEMQRRQSFTDISFMLEVIMTANKNTKSSTATVCECACGKVCRFSRPEFARDFRSCNACKRAEQARAFKAREEERERIRRAREVKAEKEAEEAYASAVRDSIAVGRFPSFIKVTRESGRQVIVRFPSGKTLTCYRRKVA
jgi:hypothetical protein